MSNVERAFAKLLGRQPSAREVQDLHRVKDALGLKDNDALWLVLIALESYDSLFRKYPEMVSAQIQRSIEDQRTAMAAIAEAEAQRALGALSDAVARTSETVAARLVDASRLQAFSFAMLMMIAFGSFCTFLGYVLGSGRLPYWAISSRDEALAMTILAAIARTPAGAIAAAAGAGLALFAAWYARREIREQRHYGLACCSGALTMLAALCLWPLL